MSFWLSYKLSIKNQLIKALELEDMEAEMMAEDIMMQEQMNQIQT